MEKPALTIRHKSNILNAAIIIVSALVAHGIYRGQIKSAESLMARKEIELKKNEVFSSILRSREKLELYKKSLDRKDASSVINTLTAIAKDSKVKIISVKPSAEENYPFYVKYPFNLIIGADSYHALGKFVSKIESYPGGIFFVDKARITPNNMTKDTQDQSRLIINLIVSAAVFND